LLLAKQPRELLVELSQMRLNHLQLLESHRQEPSIHRIQIAAGAERVPQLIGRGMQTRTPEGGNRGRIGLAIRDGAQHASRTAAEQI
jgi:hypothetical protein